MGRTYMAISDIRLSNMDNQLVCCVGFNSVSNLRRSTYKLRQRLGLSLAKNARAKLGPGLDLKKQVWITEVLSQASAQKSYLVCITEN